MPREAHDIKQAGGAVAAVRLARNIQVGLGRHLCTAAASYGAIPIFFSCRCAHREPAGAGPNPLRVPRALNSSERPTASSDRDLLSAAPLVCKAGAALYQQPGLLSCSSFVGLSPCPSRRSA